MEGTKKGTNLEPLHGVTLKSLYNSWDLVIYFGVGGRYLMNNWPNKTWVVAQVKKSKHSFIKKWKTKKSSNLRVFSL